MDNDQELTTASLCSEGTSLKEILTACGNEFELRVAVNRDSTGRTIWIGGLTLVARLPSSHTSSVILLRSIPATSAIKLTLMNGPEMQPLLAHFKRDTRRSIT